MASEERKNIHDHLDELLVDNDEVRANLNYRDFGD